MKLKKRLAAGFLAGALCLNLLPGMAVASGETVLPEEAAADGAAQLSIRTVGELEDFADRCTLDSWSRGRTILLEADLDLTGADFAPIPSFRGTFDGRGHAITGLSLTGKGSRQGLFRTIGEGGRVENLTVEGEVLPGGSRSALGLLAGESAGTITNCAVKGTVEGRTDVGGLVGRNTGTLEQCRAEVSVTGQQNTGGICGSSTGVILGCTAHGQVNTGVPNAHITDPLLNTGGVVGESTGLLDGCVNCARVGYPHSGYNVGGVAGSHQGRLTDCSNGGEVCGRKGVGGVVGRFTPDLNVVYSNDPIAELNSALSDLSASFSTLADQVSGSVDRGVDRVEGLNDELEGLRDAASDSIDKQADFAREAVDQIHGRLQNINGKTGQIHEAAESFFDDANEELDVLIEALDALRMGADDLAYAADKGLRETAQKIKDAVDELKADAQLLKTEKQELARELGALTVFLGKAGAVMARNITNEEKLSVLLVTAVNCGILDDTGRLIIDPAGHVVRIVRTQAEMMTLGSRLAAQLRLVLDSDMKEVGEARDQMSAAAARIDRQLAALNDTTKKFSDAVTDSLQAVNGDVDTIEDTLKQWADLADAEGGSASDRINGHLDAIEVQVDGMTQGVRDTNHDIHQTTETIIRQMDRVRQAAYDMAEKPVYSLEDQSEQDQLTSGYLRLSRSDAAIDGDANVGGIAGIVSFAASEDPEEELDWDWDADHPILADITAQVRAAVESCTNGGSVNAKNESAGGIVGRLDVGAVTGCVNTGNVSAEGGSFCGGIAGRCDRGSVSGSAARCVLTACDNVGGITGQGGDLTDCRAMVTVDADGEQLGSVSGWTEGELAGNYALREGLGAMDSTDLDGRAQCLDYEAFSALPGLPPEFLIFELTFVADGRKVATVPFSYNGSIDESLVPEVPPKAEHYASWEVFPTANLRRSRVVEAVYQPWDTTVSSGSNRPELLAEGAFSPEADIKVEPWTAPEALKPWDRKLCDGWSYTLTDPEREVQSVVRLRVLAESGGEHAAVAIRTDSGLELVKDAVRNGSYLTFEAPSQGQVVILSGSILPLLLMCGGGAAGILLIAGLIIRSRRRKRKNQTPQAETEESPVG